MVGDQHHYVPRFLLRNFTRGARPRIWVYDKATDRTFHTNVKNVASEKGFYDLELDDSVLTLEPGLATLETRTSTLFKVLARDKRLSNIDATGRALLAEFLAVQFVRTKEHRLRFEHLGALLAAALRERGASEEDIRRLVQEPEGVEGAKLAGIRALLESRRLVPHLLSKAWVLFESRTDVPLYISDNPMTMHK